MEQYTDVCFWNAGTHRNTFPYETGYYYFRPGKATLVTTEGGTETTIELEGELDQNALILNATTRKEVEEDSEDYSLFSTDTMRFYLLEDGKLCFTTGDSLEAEATDAEAEEDDDSMDFTIKVYFDKLVAE